MSEDIDEWYNEHSVQLEDNKLYVSKYKLLLMDRVIIKLKYKVDKIKDKIKE